MMTVTSNRRECVKCVKQNGIYIYTGSTVVSPEANVVNSANDMTTLWHFTLGHVSELALHKLSKMGSG